MEARSVHEAVISLQKSSRGYVSKGLDYVKALRKFGTPDGVLHAGSTASTR